MPPSPLFPPVPPALHMCLLGSSFEIIVFHFQAVRHLDSTLNGGRGEGQTEVNVDDENSVDISMAERPQRRITRAR